MISVIIPLFNKAHSIENTLKSLLSQTYSDFEVIVVDDGSTDNSASLVEAMSDPRITLIRKENGGVSSARNIGVKYAKGEYVAFLDADDEWAKDYLSTQVELTLLYPLCSVYVVGYQFRKMNGEILPTIINNLPFKGLTGELDNYFEVASTSHPPITSITVMCKTDAIRSINGFPEGIRSGEDLLTWAKLAVKYRIAYSRKICATYNLGEGYDFANLPPRRQDIGDPVGHALSGLYESHRDMYGLRKYISHWHKMRASVSLRYGERRETVSEVFKSLGYNPFNYKVMPFLVLAALPASIRNKIISNYKS